MLREVQPLVYSHRAKPGQERTRAQDFACTQSPWSPFAESSLHWAVPIVSVLWSMHLELLKPLAACTKIPGLPKIATTAQRF